MIITTNPDIANSYIRFDGEKHFDPICLNCALGEENKNLKGKLTFLVTLKTRYKDVNKKSVLLSFGLGKYIAVNSIIGKPSLNNW